MHKVLDVLMEGVEVQKDRDREAKYMSDINACESSINVK